MKNEIPLITPNTINICIGHLPFPKNHSDLIDVFISPNVFNTETKRKVIVPDDLYGKHGHTLSEYAQLLWLYKKLDSLDKNFEYLNIFHYRRFISPTPVEGPRAFNLPWATVVSENNIKKYEYCFKRKNNNSLFNSEIDFGIGGVMTQYKDVHHLDDYLNFTKYLVEFNILDANEALKFIYQRNFVPSCSIGIYHIDLFKAIFSILEKAAEFINSEYFSIREGYQRRSMGFLLERLHSHLITEHCRDAGSFGYNILISEESIATHTIDRID